MQAHTQLLAAGVTTRAAAALAGVPRATAARAKARATTHPTPLVRAVPAPANRLSDAERVHLLAVLNSDEFVDAPPVQVYARLLSSGTYLCSVATMYRVLAEHAQVKERRRLARHPARVRPELVATGPGQVYTWDITKLPGPVKGRYYDAYVMIDIYSRYIVGAHVHAHESGLLAEEMMRQIFGIHGVPQVVHADRGTSMTSKTVAALLSDLNVTRSHSRAKVSNDPFSESAFKTLKYRPDFPKQFGSIEAARAHCQRFFTWYNDVHHHGGLGLHTPADVHHGHAAAVREQRAVTLSTAYQDHPERFVRHPPTPPRIPSHSWINPPAEMEAIAQ